MQRAVILFSFIGALMFGCSCPRSPVGSPASNNHQSAADAGASTVRFVALGDTGKSNDAQMQVGKAVGAHCAAKGCDFVVLLGDNFYPSGVESTSDPLWQSAFVEPYAPVNAPFYAVLGNHDYGADGMGTDLPRGQHEIDYSSVNPKWRMPANHYHWTVAHAEFFAADTNRSMFSIDQDVRGNFDAWFTASTATWKVVFAHHPYKSNGHHGNAGSYDDLPLVPIVNGAGVKRFVEEHVCGRADVYLSGHDHHLEWIEETCTRPGSNTHTTFLISGAGASHTNASRTQPTHFKTSQLGFVYVVISGNEFRATFHGSSGEELFTRSISK